MKLITENKQAYFEYFVEESYIAGIVLEGAEVKSIRAGSVNLKDAFCSLYNGEVFVRNMHVAVYDRSGAFNSKDSKRERKLLLTTWPVPMRILLIFSPALYQRSLSMVSVNLPPLFSVRRQPAACSMPMMMSGCTPMP